MKTRKQPTHRLKFLDKRTEEKGQIGAGWENADGSISIALNPMVTLRQDKEVVLTLFRADRGKE